MTALLILIGSLLAVSAVAFISGCVALAIAGRYDLEGGGQDGR